MAAMVIDRRPIDVRDCGYGLRLADAVDGIDSLAVCFHVLAGVCQSRFLFFTDSGKASTHRQNWGPMVGECGVDGSVDGVLVIDAWTRASGEPWVINGANANSRKRTIPENR